MHEYLNIVCCFLSFYHKSWQWKQSICIILWALNYFAVMQQYSLMLALQFSLFLIHYEYLEGMGPHFRLAFQIPIKSGCSFCNKGGTDVYQKPETDQNYHQRVLKLKAGMKISCKPKAPRKMIHIGGEMVRPWKKPERSLLYQLKSKRD